METISNIATTATSTVSNLIYGDTAQKDTKNNETAGKEPVSGQEGKGTIAEPYDKGNLPTPLATADKNPLINPSQGESTKKDEDFLKLSADVEGPKSEEGAPKIHTNTADTTYTGMPIVPLNPDAATSGPDTTKSTETTGATGITDKAGVTDKVWKDTPLDDISRSGAPGAGPEAPTGTTAASAETHQGSGMPTKSPNAYETAAIKSSKDEAEIIADSTATPKTETKTAAKGGNLDASKPGAASEAKGLAEEKPSKSTTEAEKSTEPLSKSSSEEKTGKMSHLKEKLKDKLHIGSKDK